MQKFYSVTAILVLTLVLAGCTATNNAGTSSSSSSNTSTSTAATYALSDVSAHSSRSDCWMVIDSKVYNVTAYISSHPGGAEILQGCGKDATQLFATKGDKQDEHSRLATQTLAKYYIGDLK